MSVYPNTTTAKVQPQARTRVKWGEVALFTVLAYGLTWTWVGIKIVPHLGESVDRLENAHGFYVYLRKRAVSNRGNVRPDARGCLHAAVRQPGGPARFIRLSPAGAVLLVGGFCPHPLPDRHQPGLSFHWQSPICPPRRENASVSPTGHGAAAHS